MRVARLLICCFTWLLPVCIQAQAPAFTTTADRDSMLIGEQFNITVTLTAPEAFINSYSWASFPDTLNHFEVVNRGDVSKETSGGMVTATQVITLTSFDSGRWVIPALTEKGFVVSGGKEFYVNTVPVSPSDDYRDIHDIIDVKKPFNYRPWLIGAAIALTLALLARLVFLFLKKKKAQPKPAAPRISALEEAMQEMEKLRAQQWPEAGEYKKFHDQLDKIFRRFLHRQYHTSSIYETNEEVLLELKQRGISGGYTTEIAQALRLNNFVKFADYQPGAEQSYQSWQAVKEAIQKVKTATTEEHAVQVH